MRIRICRILNFLVHGIAWVRVSSYMYNRLLHVQHNNEQLWFVRSCFSIAKVLESTDHIHFNPHDNLILSMIHMYATHYH